MPIQVIIGPIHNRISRGEIQTFMEKWNIRPIMMEEVAAPEWNKQDSKIPSDYIFMIITCPTFQIAENLIKYGEKELSADCWNQMINLVTEKGLYTYMNWLVAIGGYMMVTKGGHQTRYGIWRKTSEGSPPNPDGIFGNKVLLMRMKVRQKSDFIIHKAPELPRNITRIHTKDMHRATKETWMNSNAEEEFQKKQPW